MKENLGESGLCCWFIGLKRVDLAQKVRNY